jgi:putative transposase
MRDWQGQSQVKWYCKYHVVFVPKYRRRSIYGALRRKIGGILRKLGQEQGVEIMEGHPMPDHIHLCLSIPPKYSVANTVGLLKGKSALRIHRQFLGQKRNFTGLHFWACGYCLSTIGLDEAKLRAYIRDQKAEEKRQEQLRLQGL